MTIENLYDMTDNNKYFVVLEVVIGCHFDAWPPILDDRYHFFSKISLCAVLNNTVESKILTVKQNFSFKIVIQKLKFFNKR